MGDRALIIFIDERCKDVSPVVYLHWSGSRVTAWLHDLAERMRGREGDPSYAAARFIGICHERIEGNLSLGTWNTPAKLRKAALHHRVRPEMAAVLREYSHGDAGVIVVNTYGFTWKAFGGYLEENVAASAAA